MAAVMRQPMSLARDLAFDLEPSTGQLGRAGQGWRQAEAARLVETVARRVAGLHGCLPGLAPTPLLQPHREGSVYQDTESLVRLLTRAGDLVSLPHDLRVPLARQVCPRELL